MNSATNPEILIIDDDKVACLLLSTKIKKVFSIPVTVRHHGQAALEYLENSQTKNFLILLDINMPVMNGWEFLEAVTQDRRIASRVQVIMISSSVNPSDKEKGLEYPLVLDFFVKPVLNLQFGRLKAFMVKAGHRPMEDTRKARLER